MTDTEPDEHELFDTFFAASMDHLAVADLAGNFTKVNDAWTTTFGWTRDEMLGRPFLDFVHPDDRAATAAVYARQRAAAVPVRGHENRYRSTDGTYRWLQWNAVTLLDRGVVLSTARDVTEAKAAHEAMERLNADLRRSNADLEQFAYVASHDLSEPLRTISGFSGLLVQKYDDRFDDEGRRYLEFVSEGVIRMQEQLSGLLAYARLGAPDLEPVPVDLTQIVARVVASLGTAIDEAGATVECGDLPVVLAHPSHMVQVFQNLIANSLKFRREDVTCHVRITSRRAGTCEVIDVDDNGIGIEPRYRDRVFRLFARLHTRDVYEGNGLGLTAAKRVVEQWGGAIAIADNDLGGTRITFELPAADAAGSSPLAALITSGDGAPSAGEV